MTARRRESKPPSTTRLAHAQRLLFGLAVWAGVHALAVWSARPPTPLDEDASGRLFSATRAMTVLEELVRENVGPHTTGTLESETVRRRIVTHLKWLGYLPEVQEQFAVGEPGVCGRMRNVVARKPGSGSEPAVLVLCHYDSVAAGPGVGDDMSGVAAALEIARAVAEDKRRARDVIFLFTEGEEQGLVGAAAFARYHRWADDVGVVLNMEARGTSGPSYLFETGEDNGWLIDLYAQAVPNPTVTSVSVEVYRRMPNDTDYTIFRERGVPGLNFAFIGGGHRYHTPLDNVEHLSLASLQQQGDQVLAMLRAIDTVRGPTPKGDTVCTTLFGFWVLRLSEPVVRLLALVAMLGILWGARRAMRRGQLSWWQLAGGAFFSAFLFSATVGAGIGLIAALRLATGSHAPWHGAPSPTMISLFSAAAVTWCLLVPLGRRLFGSAGLTQGAWVGWGLVGLLLALFAPGVSYLFVIPAVWMALIANGVRAGGSRDVFEARLARAAIFLVGVAVVLWAPLQQALHSGFGVGASPVVMAPLAILGSLALPLLANVRGGGMRLAGSVAVLGVSFSFLMAFLLPHQTPQRPARMNLVYAQNGDEAEWQVWTWGGGLPRELAFAAPFERDESAEPSGRGRVSYVAPAENIGLEPPTFEVVSEEVDQDGRRRVVGRLRSPTRAYMTELRVGEAFELEMLRAEGVDLGASSGMGFVAVPEEGFEVELVARPLAFELAVDDEGGTTSISAGEMTLTLVDHLTGGLPLAGEFLADARSPAFVPSHAGDGSTVVAEIVFSTPEPPE